MKADQERVRNLLTDTVTLLCKNGLQFNKELKVQGLLGITTDDNDVFVVHINEKFGEAIGSASILVRPDADSRQTVEVRGRKRSQKDGVESDSPAKKSATSFLGRTRGTPLGIKVKSEDTEIFEVDCIETESGTLAAVGDDDDRDAMRTSYSTRSGRLGEDSSGLPSTVSASQSVGESGSDQSQGQEELLAFIKSGDPSTDVDEEADFSEPAWDSAPLGQGSGSLDTATGTSSSWVSPRARGRHRNTTPGSDDTPCLSAKKRGKMKRYSHTQLEVAYKSVKEDGIPVGTAAKLHGVPKSTLRDRVSGRVSLDARHGSMIFSRTDEKRIVECLELVNKIGYGCTRAELLTMGSTYAHHIGKRDRSIQLGAYWIGTFLSRWPDMNMTLSSKPQPASKEAVDEYYAVLSDLIKKYNCTSGKVYIVSEKEICLDHSLPCILSTQSIRAHPHIKREKCVTLTAAVNTAGESVPPFFVFPEEREDDITVLEGASQDTGLMFSETGASSSDTMKTYVTEHLAKHIKPPSGSHVLLLYDSPRCPLPLEVQQVALEHGFVTYYITPPQEDDRANQDSLFPLGKTLKDHCTSFVQDQPECSFNTDTICHLACKAYTEALTAKNIEQAFQHIGIIDPVN